MDHNSIRNLEDIIQVCESGGKNFQSTKEFELQIESIQHIQKMTFNACNLIDN